ncbi:hypothetical protein QA601_15260 [Chitinispirillales bacterium ANBcel5]|uniref:hypothetical protein n=1 Tax=Cellulosispirillum alkaliphilum TaxID=3039283 RepID=UPI002A542C29|nr:hypothetical protein [Chitinispirillales bacterium ANBcel5]
MKPKSKVKRERIYNAVNLTEVHSIATTRAINYLSNEIGKYSRITPQIVSDEEKDDKWNFTFLSVGGHTNFKSTDVIESNEFLKFDVDSNTIISVKTGHSVLHNELDSKYKDFGVIIKTNPESNLKRTWICCAGLSEWGTSGAAWWLANNWKQIRKKAKKGPFAVVTCTRKGSDESTVLVKFCTRAEDVECDDQELSGNDQLSTTSEPQDD